MIYATSNITSREKQVLSLISFGHNTNDIAKELYLSPHTIISYRRRLMSKLKAKNIAGLVRAGFECGILII